MAKRQALFWPPVHDNTSSRIKGFYSKIIGCHSEAMEFINEARQLKNYEATRISIRAVASEGTLPTLAQNKEGYSIEAGFSIGYIFPGCSMIYFSHNKAERSPGRKAEDRENARLNEIKRGYGALTKERLAKMAGAHSVTRLLAIDHAAAAEIASLFGIFSKYPVDTSPEAIMQMPLDHVIFCSRNQRGGISALFMADKESILLARKTITSFDFVNVLAPDARNASVLIPLLAHHVIGVARHYENPVVYAEARADAPTLQASCVRAGMEYAGMLRASSLMLNRQEKEAGEYVNTQVWHVPEKALK